MTDPTTPIDDVAAPPADAPGRSPTFSPLYQQIKALFVQNLQAGAWRPGELIPSEIELASRYGVSQGTVRKAIDEMAAENLVVRKQGKGTFVATHREEGVSFRFLRLLPDDGVPEYPSRRVLDCRRLRAPAEVARLLEIPPGDPVVEIKRVLSFAGQPKVLDDIWLPGGAFKGLTADKMNAWQGPMYAMFESEFGVHMVRARERLRAVAADADVAAGLAVGVGEPLLMVERVSYTWGDKPVEVRRGWYVTDGYSYQADLN